MLDNRIVAVDTLPTDADQWCCFTLLDANAIDKMLEWLEVNPNFIGRLVDKTWKLSVLRHHVESRPDARKVIKRLQTFQINIAKYNAARNKALITEIQRAYVAGEADSVASAELLAYGRQESTDGRPVRIISRYKNFRFVPRIELYFIPQVQDIGSDNDATYLRTFAALDLHPKIVRAAFKRIEHGDYPVAIVEAVKTLFAEVQQIVEPVDAGVAGLDGYQLIHQAFDCAPEEKKKDGTVKPERLPKIKLNELNKDSEWSEQKGFRDLGCGTASAIRNPISHTAVDLDFIHERFGDRRTALKFLCLLSLLFEKLDKRVAPR